MTKIKPTIDKEHNKVNNNCEIMEFSDEAADTSASSVRVARKPEQHAH